MLKARILPGLIWLLALSAPSARALKGVFSSLRNCGDD
jgi:hypothetical protein